MRRLRDFGSINDFFSDREIGELQAAIDARRQARGPEAPGRSTERGGWV